MIKAYARLRETAASSLDTQALSLLKAVSDAIQKENDNTDDILRKCEDKLEKLLGDISSGVVKNLKKQGLDIVLDELDIDNGGHDINGEATLFIDDDQELTIYLSIDGNFKGSLDFMLSSGGITVDQKCTAVKPQADLISSTLDQFYGKFKKNVTKRPVNKYENKFTTFFQTLGLDINKYNTDWDDEKEKVFSFKDNMEKPCLSELAKLKSKLGAPKIKRLGRSTNSFTWTLTKLGTITAKLIDGTRTGMKPGLGITPGYHSLLIFITPK